MSEWISVEDRLPDNGVPVKTRIEGRGGSERNVQTLARNGNLWWLEDMSMYVYYTPTHWMPLSEPPVDNKEEGA